MNRKPIGLLVVLLGFATALGVGLAAAQNSADTLTLRLDGATAVYVRDNAGEFASFVVDAPQFVNAAFSERWVVDAPTSRLAAAPAPQVMIRLAAGFDGFSDCSEDTLAKEWRAGELVTIQGEDGRRYWVSNVTLAANQQEPAAPASTPPLPDGQWACSVNLRGEDIERLVFALDEWDAARLFFEQARLRGWPVAYPDCSR